MTRLLIVRHGESEANIRHLIAGHTDVALTSLGLEQAEQTAEHLRGEAVVAVYSSDLRRAMQTAEPHAAMRGLSVIPTPALREVFCGEWEARTVEELAQQDNERYVKGFLEGFGTFRVPGGESIPEVGARALQALVEIAKRHEGGAVVVAGHGASIRMLWALMCGIPNERVAAELPYPSNASYSVAEWDGERLVPVEYSHDGHLSCVTHLHL